LSSSSAQPRNHHERERRPPGPVRRQQPESPGRLANRFRGRSGNFPLAVVESPFWGLVGGKRCTGNGGHKLYITLRSETTAAVSEPHVMSKRAKEKPGASNIDHAFVEPQGPFWQRLRVRAPLTGGPVVETRCERFCPPSDRLILFSWWKNPCLQRSRNGGSSHGPAGKQWPVWCDGLRSGGATLVRLTRVCAAWLETHLISSYTTLELPWAEAERPAVWVRRRDQSTGREA
jgi:hypothetical protein